MTDNQKLVTLQGKHTKYKSYFLKILFIYFRREGKGGRKRGSEGNIDVREKHQLAASHMAPARDLTHNPGMCPGREPNWRPYGLQADT